MPDIQIQTIKDVIKMAPRLNIECLNSIKILMEKAIYNLPNGDVKKLADCKN